VLTSTQSDIDVADLRKMGDFLRDKEENVVAVLAAVNGDKVSFLAVCGKQAIARGIKAGDIIKAVSAVAGGKGGGKAESAMGGGTNVLKTDDALAIVDDLVAEKLGL
jgi:alanyl-tRNA synthetase